MIFAVIFINNPEYEKRMEGYECQTSRISDLDLRVYAILRGGFYSAKDRLTALEILGVSEMVSEREARRGLAEHLLLCHPCRDVYDVENRKLSGYSGPEEAYLLATERVAGVFASRLVQEIRQEATILPFPKRKEI